jgi:hypothetical protein
MSDIFISYAREDLDRVAPLAQALTTQGWDVFWDRTIPTGKTWREVIGGKLDVARCVIVVWSRHSIRSDWVQEEADVGRERAVLVPVLIDDVKPPLGFRAVQAASLLGWDGAPKSPALAQLLADIGKMLDAPTGADRPTRAPDIAPRTRDSNEASSPPNISGEWVTSVFSSAYSPDDQFSLLFEFVQQEDALLGTVVETGEGTNRGVSRAIVDAKIKNNVISFHTRGEVTGGPNGTLLPYKEMYVGTLAQGGQEIAFRRYNDVSSGGEIERFVAKPRR